MMSHSPVSFCNPTSRENTAFQDWTDGISLCLLSVRRDNLIPASISCPLFTLLSLHLIFCSTSALSACSMSFPPLVISPPFLLISLSSIHSSQCNPALTDPLIEISAQQAEAQREMLFRGNFWRGLATLSVPLQQAELSVELGFRPGRYNENVGDSRTWVRRSEIWGDDICKHKETGPCGKIETCDIRYSYDLTQSCVFVVTIRSKATHHFQ